MSRIKDTLASRSTAPPPPSLDKIEEVVSMIKDMLASHGTAPPPPALNRIEEAVGRIPDTLASTCTASPPPSLDRIEQAVNRMELTLASPSTAPPPPSLNRIEEAVSRVEDMLAAPSTAPPPPALNRIEERVNGMAQSVAEIAKSLTALNARVDLLQLQIDRLDDNYGLSSSRAADSCAGILDRQADSPSGYYYVRNTTGHAHRVYCDMTRSCSGVTGGWTRVAYLDMTNTSHHCPLGLRMHNFRKRTCIANSDYPTCSSTIYPASNIRYSNICGKINGYHSGTMNGFANTPTMEDQYVDGVSITHGRSPRQHIWSFAVVYGNACPCETPPPAVGNDFFCDVGGTNDLGNPLWDGIVCNGGGTCCSHNSPPWFHKRLPQPTTDDIEIRVCRDQNRSNEDVLIETIEIYVQ